MFRVALVSGGDLSALEKGFDLYVAVDRACLYLIENDFPLDLAVGDFDSVSREEFDRISQVAGQLYQSPAEKDDTDTELALKLIFATHPDAEVTILGAFGGRMDHQLSNLFLPSDAELTEFISQISLVDAQNHISYRPAGRHQILPEQNKTYISFLLEGDGDLQIIGAKYELTKDNFFRKKIYSSNEFLSGPIEISLTEGYVIVMQTRDR